MLAAAISLFFCYHMDLFMIGVLLRNMVFYNKSCFTLFPICGVIDIFGGGQVSNVVMLDAAYNLKLTSVISGMSML